MSANIKKRSGSDIISRAMREPLLQFLAAGLVLFLADSLLNGAAQRDVDDAITITQGRIQQIAESFRLQAGRMPTDSELQSLVDDFIDEEVYYREAIALGLDTDDTIIRRRMRQKLEFLTEDPAVNEDPSEEQLIAWLHEHSAAYHLPARISFRHVLASTDRRGVDTETDATAFLTQLKSGAAPEGLGDMSMLPSTSPLTTQKGVVAQFGDEFAETLFNHNSQGWFGPVNSPFGAHAVQILSREPAYNPQLDEVREKLKSDWIDAKRQEKQNAYRARLRKRYDISIDWPEPYAGKSTAQNDTSAN